MAASTDARGELLEREDEIAVVEAVIQNALRANGQVLVVEGPAGIGKTSLLREVEDRAAARGLIVHRARGDELESSLPYGVARQLFEPVGDRLSPESRRLLGGGPADAASAIVDDAPTTPGATSAPAAAASVAYSLFRLAEELAEQQPRVFCVDDAQWADADSLRALAFLARRIETLPAVLVLTSRTDPPSAVAQLLSSCRYVTTAKVLALAPLAEAGVAALTRRHIGSGFDPALIKSLRRASGGNPFLVHEVLVGLRTAGWSGVEADPAQLARLAPDTVARFVLRRLAATGDEAQRLARAISVLGGAPLALAAALADVDESKAVEAADRLAASEILEPELSLQFVHPILREAVRADIPALHRALMHARAARLLADRGAASEDVATHLLEALPRNDPWAASVLLEAALRARDRGSPEVAVTMLARALAEPPARSVRSVVALELGTAEAALGRPSSLATLEQAVEWADNPTQRSEAQLALARASFMVLDTDRVLAIADELGSGPAPIDRDLLVRLEGEVLGSARLYAKTRDDALIRLDRLRNEALPPRPATVGVLANLALSAVERNEGPQAVAELARLALTDGWLGKQNNNQIAYVINALAWTDLLDEAVAAAGEVLDWAVRSGSLIMSTMAYTARSRASLRRGDVVNAEADARVAHALAHEHDWHQIVPFTASHLADALLQHGAVDEARAVLADIDDPQAARAVPDYLDSLGRTDLVRTQPASALEQFLACGRQLTERGGVDAPGIVPWRSNAALALTALGRRARACDMAQEEYELATASGVAGSIGVAQTALGIAHGEDVGIAWLERAVSTLGDSPRVLARITALIELGAMTRRARRPTEARSHLTLALDLAHRHGAAALAERARTELKAAGARPRRESTTGVDALTASERRVADLVAAGLSNREIANQLYVSMRTIGTHLTRVYQKLGIASREEIATTLAR